MASRSVVDIAEEKYQEQREALGGWVRAGLIFAVLITLLYIGIQNALGIPLFDRITGKAEAKNNTAANVIVGLTLVFVLGFLFFHLRRCDYSLACFLLGGIGGRVEQPVNALVEAQIIAAERKKAMYGQKLTVQPMLLPPNSRVPLGLNVSSRTNQPAMFEQAGQHPGENQPQYQYDQS